MLKLFFRLLKHPSRDHRFTQSRSQSGMMTCKICKLRLRSDLWD